MTGLIRELSLDELQDEIVKAEHRLQFNTADAPAKDRMTLGEVFATQRWLGALHAELDQRLTSLTNFLRTIL